MSQNRFNQLFVILLAAGLAGSLLIPPSITDRAKGKEELLLYPIVKPVRTIAGMLDRKYAHKSLPPGETVVRSDTTVAAENVELRQQVLFLRRQLESLQFVESERKHLGPLFDYFKPVSVLNADATPGRESLAIAPASGIDTSAGAPVMYSDGLAGKMIDGRKVRLITDKDFIITGEFVRWENEKYTALKVPKASVRGIGNGTMRVENLTIKEAENAENPIKPGDWVVISDPDFVTDPRYKELMQGRPIGQVETVRPIPTKPLFAEIVVKPRADLQKLREVLVARKRDQ